MENRRSEQIADHLLERLLEQYVIDMDQVHAQSEYENELEALQWLRDVIERALIELEV